MSQQEVIEERLSSHGKSTQAIALNLLDNNFPLQWKMVRLEEVASYINGYAFKPSDWGTKGLPIIRIQNLNDPTKQYNYFAGQIPERYLVREGDILISWSASLGTYMWSGTDAWLNQHIFKAIVKENIIFRDYFYWVMTRQIEHIAAEQTYGSTMKHVVQKSFLNSQIPLPPLSEQHAIAKVLRTMYKAILLRRDELELGRERKAALMEYLFTHGAHNEPIKRTEIGEIPESWQVVRLGEVFMTQLGKMLSPKAKVGKFPKPYMRNANVQWGHVDYSEVFEMDSNENEKTKFRLKNDDILVCEGGEVGRTAIWRDELSECYFQKAIHRLRPRSNQMLPTFFLYHMEHAFLYENIYGVAGTETTIAHLPQDKLVSMLIPKPSLDEQKLIAQILEACDTCILTLQREIKLLEELFKAVLEELMTGQLSTLPLIAEGEAHE